MRLIKSRSHCAILFMLINYVVCLLGVEADIELNGIARTKVTSEPNVNADNEVRGDAENTEDLSVTIEQDKAAKAEGRPKAEPSNKAEPEGTAEGEGSPEPTAKPEAEPDPDWDTAIPKWGAAWYMHVYISAFFYIAIFVVTLIVFAEVTKTWRTKRKPLVMSLAGFLFIFSACRIIVLAADPYNYRRCMQRLLWRVLWVSPYPALTTSFCVVLLVLIDTTKMSIAPPKFQKLSSIMIIAALHFFIVIGTEFIVFYFVELIVLVFVCQILTFTWGLFLVVGYTMVGLKIHRNLAASMKIGVRKDDESNKIFRLRRIIFISAVTGFAYSITGLYGAVGVFGIMGSNGTEIEAWPWWIFQTFSRVTEIVMCLLTIAVALKTPNIAVFGLLKRAFIRSVTTCKKRSGTVSAKSLDSPDSGMAVSGRFEPGPATNNTSFTDTDKF